jgi:beta-N-acetylhexosaminidase
MTLAMICGCSGLALTLEEVGFIREAQPWGLILFKRNVADKEQVLALASSFRALVGRKDAPVLIDQEGGRVQRLAAPNWPAYPSAASYDSSIADPAAALDAAQLGARLIAHDLHEAGINVNCAPVLDLAQPGAHPVIGSRSYSSDPMRVAAFGRVVAEALMAGGVAPVIKHMPGHGRATVDSHLELPVVNASLAELARSDFAPFAALGNLPMAMTAHVVYTAVDPAHPATTSPEVVSRIMRDQIGFGGLIISDDLSMKALGGSFAERARGVFGAGVDIALHCNGDLAEAGDIAGACPQLVGESLRRAEAALATIAREPEPLDIAEASARLATALDSAEARG